jgi:hypothetical protein
VERLKALAKSPTKIKLSNQRMSIKEILEELPKLTPEERQEVRDWLAADEFAETDELIAAVDEGIRSAQSGSSLSIEEAKELIHKRALRSASAVKQGKI